MFTDTFVLGHDTEIMALAKGSAPFDTTAGAGGGTSVVNMSDADLDQISDAYGKTPVEMLYSYNLEGTSATGGEVDLTPTGSLFDGEVGRDLTNIIGQPQQSAPATGYTFDQLAALTGSTGEGGYAYAEALYEHGGTFAMEAFGMGDMIDRGGDEQEEKDDERSPPPSPTLGPRRALPAPSPSPRQRQLARVFPSPARSSFASPARGSALSLDDLATASSPRPPSAAKPPGLSARSSVRIQASLERKKASRAQRAARGGKKLYQG
jgi:hypothetical protein